MSDIVPQPQNPNPSSTEQPASEGGVALAEATANAAQPGAAARERGALERLIRNRGIQTVIGVYMLLDVLLFVARFINPSLGSVSFVKTVIALSAFTAFVAYGQGLVILTGGFDLSIPNVMTIAGVTLTGYTLGSNSKAAFVIPLVLLLGAAIGVVNGIGIVYFKLSPVVMTLATNVILSGVVLVETKGTPKGVTPSVITGLAQGNLGFLPTIIVVMIVFAVLGVLLLNGTVFGRQVYAVGSNREVAYLSGVPVNRVLLAVYAISGLCAAFGGIMVAGYGNQSYLNMGDPYLLLSLAAVVVGGSTVVGGRGYYLGTLAGAMVLVAVSTILSGTTLPEAIRQIVYAGAILIAVLVTRQQ